MRIFFVAVFTPNSTNISQANALARVGCDVVRYDYRRRASELRGNTAARDDDLIAEIKRYKPDLTIFAKCNRLHYRVVDSANEVGQTCLWFPDWPGNTNAELWDKVSRTTFSCWARQGALDLALRYTAKAHFLAEGFDPLCDRPHDVPYVRDVGFIGGLHRDRVDYYKQVGFEVLGGLYGEAHARAVSETRINLGFSEGDGTSDRTYKVLAAGGFLLTQPWLGLERNFAAGRDFDLFTDPDDLKGKIWFYLEHPEIRKSVAAHGRETVQLYSRDRWAINLLSHMS